MRKLARLAPVCLGVLTVVALARSAAAQTYVWTDERGVVHAAAEPSEVPEKYRAKSVRDAERPRSNVTVLQPDESTGAPAAPSDDPTAPAPMKPGYKSGRVPPPPHAEPAAEEPPKPSSDDEATKKKGLPDPAPGFEWNCTPDPEGGKPKCEQFEKRASKRARHADARAKAREQLGVGDGDEVDPDMQEQLDRRADKEYEKTTQKPNAHKKASDEDGESSDDSEE